MYSPARLINIIVPFINFEVQEPPSESSSALTCHRESLSWIFVFTIVLLYFTVLAHVFVSMYYLAL